MSGYNNGTVNSLVYAAAADRNPSNVSNDYAQITKLMYNNYTDAWLVVPTQYAVYNSNLHGFLENPMASSEPFTLSFQTQYMS
jgi:ABC-type transport system substrate-binding protein